MDRLNPWTAAPEIMKQMVAFSEAQGAGLEPALIHLVKVRSSQINGCAICVHMHTQEARKDGEREERLFLLDAWREARIYTAREKAALAWTEALTRLAETRAPDEAYDAVTAVFTPLEVVKLTMLINVINAFNRIGVGFRLAPLGLKPLAEAA
jgi:AhpD family alkylhydroperoxidase